MAKRKELTCTSFVPTKRGEYIPFDNLSIYEKQKYAEKLKLIAAQAYIQSCGLKATIDEETYTLIIS